MSFTGFNRIFFSKRLSLNAIEFSPVVLAAGDSRDFGLYFNSVNGGPASVVLVLDDGPAALAVAVVAQRQHRPVFGQQQSVRPTARRFLYWTPNPPQKNRNKKPLMEFNMCKILWQTENRISTQVMKIVGTKKAPPENSIKNSIR